LMGFIEWFFLYHSNYKSFGSFFAAIGFHACNNNNFPSYVYEIKSFCVYTFLLSLLVSEMRRQVSQS
jgi:hypothetical protein